MKMIVETVLLVLALQSRGRTASQDGFLKDNRISTEAIGAAPPMRVADWFRRRLATKEGQRAYFVDDIFNGGVRFSNTGAIARTILNGTFRQGRSDYPLSQRVLALGTIMRSIASLPLPRPRVAGSHAELYPFFALSNVSSQLSNYLAKEKRNGRRYEAVSRESRRIYEISYAFEEPYLSRKPRDVARDYAAAMAKIRPRVRTICRLTAK